MDSITLIANEAEKIQKMYDAGEIDRYEKRDLEQELLDYFEELCLKED